ncbi:BTB/POZ domain-containing protein 1 isoform X1 [Pyrgilauda ruficollis]|uniref:BTB/POZ domain-containing protein 1 isoform X1 n=1 Tax=Pyrgilauda ruficollis TaxID=221976 RepID=UPI001B87E5F2|nr:BTB/POZ domain-containing protein 1 isoform X1 [Pyrgilauda ruficollis]
MDAISAEGFTDIDIDTLCAVLERDTLSIRESRLFGAVVRWAEAECQRQQLAVTFENKQKVLGRALSLIRFPLMTIEEFAAGPAQSGILSDREVVNLFLHFTVNPKPKVDYIDRPRCCLRGKECSINRFQQVESRWGYSGTSDRIRFTVNRRISIVGFGLYGSIHGPTDYQVNIQIIDYEKNQTLGQNDTGFSCDGTASTFRVMFKEPIEILPTVCYTACATLKGPDSHYGTKGLKKVIHESPTASKTCFVFYSSPDSKAAAVVPVPSCTSFQNDLGLTLWTWIATVFFGSTSAKLHSYCHNLDFFQEPWRINELCTAENICSSTEEINIQSNSARNRSFPNLS